MSGESVTNCNCCKDQYCHVQVTYLINLRWSVNDDSLRVTRANARSASHHVVTMINPRLGCFVLLAVVLCEDTGSLLISCGRDDLGCLGKSTTIFLEKSHKGIPAYDIKSIDPLFIESSEYISDAGITYKYKNIIITGLKNVVLTDYIMDTDAKSAVLTTKADLNIVADVEVLAANVSKRFARSFKSRGNFLHTAYYGYELRTNDKGMRYFEIGPEMITCSVATSPEINLSPELLQVLYNGQDVRDSKEKREEARAKALCSIVKEAYKVVIHNLRALARVMPVSAFFKDV